VKWKHFFVLFGAQCLSYGLICWNYRAVAKGYIPQVIESDLVIAAINFKILKKIASADSNLAWAGYILGSAVGSAISVWLTKYYWGN
jgi:hypothetical protein